MAIAVVTPTGRPSKKVETFHHSDPGKTDLKETPGHRVRDCDTEAPWPRGHGHAYPRIAYLEENAMLGLEIAAKPSPARLWWMETD